MTKAVSLEGGTASLGRITIAGMGWKFAASLFRILASFIFGVALARLLPPEDFGIVGIATIVTGFVYVIGDLGLRPALIQIETSTSRHERVSYTIAAGLGLALSVFLFLTAGTAASFFGDQRVQPVLQVLSLQPLFTAFSITAGALLMRRLDFKATVRIELIASVIGYGVVAVVLASMGFGYWSLVGGMIFQSALSAILTFSAARHSIRPLLSLHELGELIGFSSQISLASVAEYLSQKGDYLIIGRMMNAAALGFYTRAYTLMELPFILFGTAIGKVIFPVASRVQGDPIRIRRAYLMTLSVSVYLAYPASFAMVVVARELVLVLFGDVWVPTIIILQILSSFGLFRVCFASAGSFLKAMGKASSVLIASIAYSILIVGGSYLGASSAGLTGVSVAVGIAITVKCIFVIGIANRLLNLSSTSFFAGMRTPFVLGSLVILIVFVTASMLRSLAVNNWIVLTGTGVVFSISFAWGWVRLSRRLDHPAIRSFNERVAERLTGRHRHRV